MSAITVKEPGGDMVCFLDFSAQLRGPDSQPITGEHAPCQVNSQESAAKGVYVCGIKSDDRRVATLDLRYGTYVT